MFRSVASDSKPKKKLAPQVGLEPTTLRLTAGCSAIELLRSDVRVGALTVLKIISSAGAIGNCPSGASISIFARCRRDHSWRCSSNTQAFFVLLTYLFHSRGVYVGRSSFADFFLVPDDERGSHGLGRRCSHALRPAQGESGAR